MVSTPDPKVSLTSPRYQGACRINDQDETGFSALHAAASYRQSELLRWLIEQGGDANLVTTELVSA